MNVSRTVWRHLPAGGEPLDLAWIERARGRWNTQRPRIACLYTALTRAGALAEFRKLAAERPAFARAPRDLVDLRVAVGPVLDLCDEAVRARIGLSPGQMRGSAAADLGACRAAVRRALDDGYRAILAPSAAARGERNLMIYPESSHGRLLLSHGRSRIPINHGPAPAA